VVLGTNQIDEVASALEHQILCGPRCQQQQQQQQHQQQRRRDLQQQRQQQEEEHEVSETEDEAAEGDEELEVGVTNESDGEVVSDNEQPDCLAAGLPACLSGCLPAVLHSRALN
jgi:FtsZ-interacting cell division protein YlmF